ncbi:MAG: tetratricopeptide repeat protein [Anaerolineae bacterium]
MARLSLRFLGTYVAELDGKAVTGFSTEKERALLAYVALQPGRPLRRLHLAGLLWPEQSEERALHSCRQALSSLRRLLGEHDSGQPFLLMARDSVTFDGESDHWVDALAFRAELRRALAHYSGRDGRGRLNVRALRQAVDLYGGPLLAQLHPADCQPFEEWLLLEGESLARDAVTALALLAHYHEARGEYGLAFAAAARLAELAPWDEENHRLAMYMAAADGQWAAARSQYQTCRRCLESLLDAAPSAQTTSLLERVERRSLPPPAPVAATVLPPPGRATVGREAEMAELAGLLSDPTCRLVTITGAGGSGKTHLALEVAREQAGLFRDGVYFAAMADLAADAPLEVAVAAALGFVFSDRGSPAGQLADYLHNRCLLLVLDNLEHLRLAPAFVAQLLNRAPDLTVLATSRARLALREEWLLPLDGLAYPPGDEAPATIAGYDAVRLFLARARQLQPRFALSEADTLAAGRIGRLVDGLPLGLELAAGLLPGRTCTAIAGDIAASLDALLATVTNGPERHRSMRAVFASSYEQLADEERRVLTGLSAFIGGFDLGAAQAVVVATAAILESLRARSLVRADGSGRFSMHELLRQFAHDQLAAVPQEDDAVRRRHAHHYARLLADLAPQLAGASEGDAIDAIAGEMGNGYAAWAWAVSRRDADVLARSLPTLYRYYYDRSLLDEGVRVFEEAVPVAAALADGSLWARLLTYQGALCVRLGTLAAAEERLDRAWGLLSNGSSDADRMACLLTRAEMLMHMGRHDEATRATGAALSLAEKAGDWWGTSTGKRILGDVYHRTGRASEARSLLQEALALARTSGRSQAVVTALNSLGDVVCHLGDYEYGLRVLTESVELSRHRSDRWRLALAVNNLGTLYHEVGDFAQAATCYEESLAVCRDLGDAPGEAIALSNLGELAMMRGERDAAERLFVEGTRLAREADIPWALMCVLDNLGTIRADRGDYVGALACFREVLATAEASQAMPMLLKVLVHVAALLLRQGDSTDAVAVLRLAAGHEAAERDVQRQAEVLLLEAGAMPAGPVAMTLDEALALVSTALARRWPAVQAG